MPEVRQVHVERGVGPGFDEVASDFGGRNPSVSISLAQTCSKTSTVLSIQPGMVDGSPSAPGGASGPSSTQWIQKSVVIQAVQVSPAVASAAGG